MFSCSHTTYNVRRVMSMKAITTWRLGQVWLYYEKNGSVDDIRASACIITCRQVNAIRSTVTLLPRARFTYCCSYFVPSGFLFSALIIYDNIFVCQPISLFSIIISKHLVATWLNVLWFKPEESCYPPSWRKRVNVLVLEANEFVAVHKVHCDISGHSSMASDTSI